MQTNNQDEIRSRQPTLDEFLLSTGSGSPDSSTTSNNVVKTGQISQSNQTKQATPQHKPWSKLTKMKKLEKLYDYADTISSDHSLTPEDIDALKEQMKQWLNRKMLVRVKDIVYNKETGDITNIPGLSLRKARPNTKTSSQHSPKRFTLKTGDKKDSTLKHLSYGKKKKKVRAKIKGSGVTVQLAPTTGGKDTTTSKIEES